MQLKPLIPLLTLLLIPLYGCHKDSGTVEVPEDETPQVVKFGTNLRTVVTTGTKASIVEWTGQEDLFVYSFQTGTVEQDKVFLDNVRADSPAGGGLSGAIELERTEAGHEGEPYYYPSGTTTYDFYAYYAGTAKTKDGNGDDIEPSIAGGKVSLPVEIDGSQDLCVAIADKAADCAEAGISPLNAYSAYSSRKGIIPNLVFEHQLSRFVFWVKAGDLLGENVRIDGITLESLSKGSLVIANVNNDRKRGLEQTSTLAVLSLQNGGDGTNIEAFEPGFEGTPEYGQIGESLMVVPGADEYKLEVLMHYIDPVTGERSGDDFKYSYTLTPSMINPQPESGEAAYRAGYQYNVNIAVYGLQMVKVNVTLTQWGDGGSILIDNDNEWPDQPTKAFKMANGVYFYLYYAVGAQSPIGAKVKTWNSVTNEMDEVGAGTYEVADPVAAGFLSLTIDEDSVVTAVNS